jgi:hypothetical protein
MPYSLIRAVSCVLMSQPNPTSRQPNTQCNPYPAHSQVLCSKDLWQRVCNTPPASCPRLPQPVTAISLGSTHLKGVPEPVEVLVCRHVPPPGRMSTMTGLVPGPELPVAIEMTDGMGI